MLKVCEVTKDSPAMNNGVKEYDTLVAAYSVDKNEPIHLPHELLKQYSLRCSIILALRRQKVS